jgi:outer membrane protein
VKKTSFLLLLILNFSIQVKAEDLKEIYSQVLQSDPRLLINAIGVDVGKARQEQAFGALLPQVALNSTWSENRRRTDLLGRSTYPGERYSLTLRQPVFDMSKYRAWQGSKASAEQSVFQNEAAQAEVRLNTVERYFQLLSAQDAYALVKEEKDATAKKLRQTEALYNKQLVKVTDLYEVSARLDMLASEEVDAMQAVDSAKQGLSELTNNPVNHISPLMESTDFIQTVDNLEQWKQDLTSANPYIMSLQKDIEAAKKNLEQQKSGRYPVLELQLTKQKSDIGFESSQSQRSTTDTASLNLSVPIYSGGSISGRINEASQQVILSEATYDQEYRNLLTQLSDMFLSVNAMVRRIEASEKAIISADKSYQAMSRSFELGIATVSDVLDAQQVYLQARRGFQQAKYDYIINRAALLYISGKLDEDAFYEISEWLI